MNDSHLNQVIQAIKNFDIKMLESLLEDDKSYMDVTKETFIRRIEELIDFASRGDCYSFDDVFFGVCGSCNKGCEAITFFSNTGHYLDLFIESKDESAVDDIYVCNKLTNFIDLEKTFNLGFSFDKDEHVDYIPSKEYIILKQQYEQLNFELNQFPTEIVLTDLVAWYNGYKYAREFIQEMDLFERLNYKLYGEALSTFHDIDNLVSLENRSDHATNALLDYHSYNSERAKVIWFFENETDHYSSIYFENLCVQDRRTYVVYKCREFNFKVDITGFEYVLDYFQSLDRLYDDLMAKYEPTQIHYDEGPEGGLEYSLENYLRIHGKFLDVIKKYGEKKY